MVLPGSESGVRASPQDVAHYTVTVLARTIPPALPGVMVRLLDCPNLTSGLVPVGWPGRRGSRGESKRY